MSHRDKQMVPHTTYHNWWYFPPSELICHTLTQLDFKLHKHLTMKLGRRSTPAVFILFVEGYIFLRLYMRFVYCVARARSLKKTLDVHA